MSGLEPPKDAELNQALLDDDFDADLLARTGAVFPRQEFYKTIFWKQADSLIISDVLKWLGGRGPTEIQLFLQAAILVQPKCPRVRSFCDAHFPGLTPLASDAASRIGNFGLVQDVKLGLQVLSEKSGDADFSGTLGEFRVRLQETGRNINLLKKYKGLHNCLHNLQGQLSGIETTVALVRADSGASRSLRRIALNLKPLAIDARAQITDLQHPEREVEWIDEFDSYIAQMLRLASSTPPPAADISKISDVPNLLRALLRQQAPRINTLLVNAADALQLQNLAETMAAVANQTAAKMAPSDPVPQKLNESAAAVKPLQLRLMALVDQHYLWQDLNTSLDEADSSDKYQPQARIPKWEIFKKNIEALCERYPEEPWSRSIGELMASWIKATPSAAPSDSEKDAGDAAFNAFYRTCIERFVIVDTELNELSDEVTEVASPLDKLLAQIPKA